MRYWWVNQNQTYKHEVPGGFLWSPKAKKNGQKNHFYDTMTEVRAGDLVLSFCDTLIKAIGTAQGPAESAEKPAFGAVGDQWDKDGWLVPVEFKEVAKPVRPKDFIADLRPHFAERYNPLQEATGDGNQGVYLAEISEGFLKVILEKMGLDFEELVSDELLEHETETQLAEEALRGRTDIGETKIRQLVNARRGQGIFKANVRLNEHACRVTGVTEPTLLIASHIKPWRVSSDEEKLDGCNGLLLAPHVDRLFDRGLISFTDGGEILKGSKLPEGVWDAWGLGEVSNVGPFKPEQCAYLKFHRAEVYEG